MFRERDTHTHMVIRDIARQFCAATARSSSSSFWRSLLRQNCLPPRSSYGGALLNGFRFMSTGASPKLFVGGLSWSTDENVLKQAFSSYGDITEAKVVIDLGTGRSRGFGYVSFMSIEDAETAKEGMDGNDIKGRTVRVDFAMEKPPSARSSGGFRGGGGGNFLGGGVGFGGETGDTPHLEIQLSRSNASFPSQDTFESKDSFGRDSFASEDGFSSNFFGKDI